MKTASFHTTARKAILATLQANRDNLRVHDTREWRFLTDEEFRRLGHAKTSDVSYAGDLDDYGMFDGTWRAWIAVGNYLMRANTAYPACSSHSTTRPYGRRYAPDLTC